VIYARLTLRFRNGLGLIKKLYRTTMSRERDELRGRFARVTIAHMFYYTTIEVVMLKKLMIPEASIPHQIPVYKLNKSSEKLLSWG
jgi:hypothetical protein